MRKSNFALRLQPSLMEALRKVAQEEETTLNQYINIAVAEKLAARRTAAQFFAARAARANIPEALAVLDQLGTEPPGPGDRLGQEDKGDILLATKHKDPQRRVPGAAKRAMDAHDDTLKKLAE